MVCINTSFHTEENTAYSEFTGLFILFLTYLVARSIVCVIWGFSIFSEKSNFMYLPQDTCVVLSTRFPLKYQFPASRLILFIERAKFFINNLTLYHEMMQSFSDRFFSLCDAE